MLHSFTSSGILLKCAFSQNTFGPHKSLCLAIRKQQKHTSFFVNSDVTFIHVEFLSLTGSDFVHES